MRKGQISIDLLITLIIVIMVIGAFAVIITSYQDGQETFYIESQLYTQAGTIASFITSTNALNDTNFTAKIFITPVKYKNANLIPTVSADNNYIVVSLTNNGNTFEKKSFFSIGPDTKIMVDTKKVVASNE